MKVILTLALAPVRQAHVMFQIQVGPCQVPNTQGRVPASGGPARTLGPGNQWVEVVVTCSQYILQAVATLCVGVFSGCTVMYNMSVSKKGCWRYHWVYDDVCYDCQERLTWCYEDANDEEPEYWNIWIIYNDHQQHVANYWWWGIWASPDSNVEDYADPGLTYVKEGETVDFDIADHVERLLAATVPGNTACICLQPRRPLLCAPEVNVWDPGNQRLGPK